MSSAFWALSWEHSNTEWRIVHCTLYLHCHRKVFPQMPKRRSSMRSNPTKLSNPKPISEHIIGNSSDSTGKRWWPKFDPRLFPCSQVMWEICGLPSRMNLPWAEYLKLEPPRKFRDLAIEEYGNSLFPSLLKTCHTEACVHAAHKDSIYVIHYQACAPNFWSFGKAYIQPSSLVEQVKSPVCFLHYE